MKRLLSLERAFLALYAVLLLCGLWYGFPNLLLVADEAPYVGGVLRALSAHSLLPAIDYSYTLSFYANYILMVPVALGAFAINHFSVSTTETWLILHQYLLYLMPRLVSVLSAFALLVLFLLWFPKGPVVRGISTRLAVAVLIFCNPLFIYLAHTGKMWLLSTLLLAVTLYCFDRAASAAATPRRWYQDSTLFIGLFAGLALANFPVNVIAYLPVAYLAYLVRQDPARLSRLALGVLLGAVVLGIGFLINHAGWTTQNAITPTGAWNASGIALYFLLGTIGILPVLIIALAGGVSFAARRPLHLLLIVMTAAYALLLIVRAPWIGNGTGDYWRYFLYPVLFLGLALASLPVRRVWLLFALALITLAYGMRVVWLLSVPPTETLARAYLLSHAAGTPIVNNVPTLDLPKSAAAYTLVPLGQCGSVCAYYEAHPETQGGLFAIDGTTTPGVALPPAFAAGGYEAEYLVPSARTPVFVASSGGSTYVTADGSVGSYDPALFEVARFGRSIGIYAVAPTSR